MSTNALIELESLLQRPPPDWNPSSAAQANNPLAIAHAVLEYLRESGDEKFLFLRTIMEISARQKQNQSAAKLSAHEEEIFFHCITGCRQVALWQYKSKYSASLLQSLRDFMMILGFEPVTALHGTAVTSRTIQLACFSTSIALWKRGWNAQNQRQSESSIPSSVDVDQNNKAPTPEEESLVQGMVQLASSSSLAPVIQSNLHSPSALLRVLEQLIQTQTPGYIEASALYLQALVTEFVGRSAISYRLPLEYHKQAHRSFEREGSLTKCLGLSLTALGQVLTMLADGNTHSFGETSTVASPVVQLTMDCLGWEFGMGAWDVGKLGAISASDWRATLRPPVEWKTVLHPIPIVRALVHVILKLQENPMTANSPLSQSLRQLLLVMAKLSGPIFQNSQERQEFASILLDCMLQLLQRVDVQQENSYLIDALQLLGRLIANFRLSVLAELASSLNPVLQCMAAIGQKLLRDQVQECEQAGGDLENMELREWREDALSVLLIECAVLLASDPWLMYSGTETSRRQAQKHLASLILGPLYQGAVECRTRLAALEEHYLVSHETELDEAREEIMAYGFEEELEGISTVGRLDLETALACLAERFGQVMPRLQALWVEADGQHTVTAETAALLEEARILTLYVTHLLTDENKGEAPEIPLAVLQACQEEYDARKQQQNQDQQQHAYSITSSIASAVQALMQFAEAQMLKIAVNPTNLRLSPMLAKTFLQFLQRWGPSYIYPIGYKNSHTENPIVHEWAQPEKAQQAATFCITLCLSYACYWPQENLVQEEAHRLLLSLVKRGGRLRAAVVNSPVFVETVKFHCVSAGIRHGVTDSEFENTVRGKLGDVTASNLTMIQGFQRLPYDDRAQILSIILVACSDSSHPASLSLFNDALKAVHDSFSSLIHALANGVIRHDDVNAKEMTCLCLAMLYGVTTSSEMQDSERIPLFMTPFLPQLAGLMGHYATDLSVCEKLLQIFHNYAAQFVVILNREQSVALFQASAELLKSYSANHCTNRVIRKSNAEAEAEEEQAYNDILCAIRLLINLGAKDFIDACSTSGETGVDSSQVTDMIFFGLQQLLPLMTQGLLQFPTLCTQFFELVGFMMDSYPDKVCRLPYDMFNPLLQSLLFGMSHHDVNVARCSLLGLASIAKEHLETQALAPILTQHAPDLLDRCIQRLFTEVIFRSVVMDRLELVGLALLPLAAADLPGLSGVMTHLCETTYQKDDRLKQALRELFTSERVSKASSTGYDGRANRVLFKEAFEIFVHRVQSFLVLR